MKYLRLQKRGSSDPSPQSFFPLQNLSKLIHFRLSQKYSEIAHPSVSWMRHPIIIRSEGKTMENEAGDDLFFVSISTAVIGDLLLFHLPKKVIFDVLPFVFIILQLSPINYYGLLLVPSWQVMPSIFLFPASALSADSTKGRIMSSFHFTGVCYELKLSEMEMEVGELSGVGASPSNFTSSFFFFLRLLDSSNYSVPSRNKCWILPLCPHFPFNFTVMFKTVGSGDFNWKITLNQSYFIAMAKIGDKDIHIHSHTHI